MNTLHLPFTPGGRGTVKPPPLTLAEPRPEILTLPRTAAPRSGPTQASKSGSTLRL
jgi:hypothetical protein